MIKENLYNEEYEELLNKELENGLISPDNPNLEYSRKYQKLMEMFIKNPKKLKELSSFDIYRFSHSPNQAFIKLFAKAIDYGDIRIEDMIKYNDFLSAPHLVSSYYTDTGGMYNDKDNHFVNKGINAIINRLSIEKKKELIEVDVNYILRINDGINTNKAVLYKALLDGVSPEKKNQVYSLIDKVVESGLEPYELKVLFNKDIVNSNSIEDIENFINESISNRQKQLRCFSSREFSNTSLANLIENAYGDKASSIIRNRPGLNIVNINSLEVFDSRIIDKFGEGFVNDLISYNTLSFSRFLLIMKDPSSYEKFTEYHNLLADEYGYNMSVFQHALSTYYKHENLLKNISINDLEEIEKSDLLEYFMNVHRTNNVYATEEELFAPRPINTLEDVIYYNSKYKVACMDQINAYDYQNSENYREMLANYFFNMNYGVKGYGGVEDLDTDINQSLRYQINQFGNVEIENLTEEEQEIIRVGKIICNSSIDYYEKTQELVRKMQPFDIKVVNNLFQKMQKQYISDLNSQLLNPNNLSDAKKIDGVDVYFLTGTDFKASIHKPPNGNGVSNEKLNTNASTFLDFEEQSGLSTISTWFIDSTDKNDITMGMNYGFSTVAEDEFLINSRNQNNGAAVTHYPKSINPKGILADNNLTRSELAYYRRNRNYKERKEDLEGRKKIDYIFVGVSELNEDSAKEIAKSISYAKKYNVPVVVVDWSKYKTKERTDLTENAKQLVDEVEKEQISATEKSATPQKESK